MMSNQKRPKFKYTKELVTIALNDGMTQEEVARHCRVSQSVVSTWKNGRAKATEAQLKTLIERYGQRLNRTSTRLYMVAEPFSPAKLAETELGRQLVAQSKNEEVGFDHPFFLRDEMQRFAMPTTLVRVEGAIVFRYSFAHPYIAKTSRDGTIDIKSMRLGRWLLHHQARDRFVLVRQVRRMLLGPARWGWLRYVARNNDRVANELGQRADCPPLLLESPVDAARWLSMIEGPLNAHQLLEFADRYLAAEHTRHTPHDEQVLPFLVRDALISLGYRIPGITLMSARDEVE
ncbi:helix-turn-helix domain-containing protein [Haliangium ochraceum]|uniref:Helix-turn-helix domain protein n=1 Tax=Haliangium ochraceum (strain DSM 14365 / JCM 11303 / SMP-2) TaxID=502025 RepID=D0LLN6_HALO1|nr:helix-turn-helix transcriptional regulator [Haliangium ochraceum]ACY13253.1 helix-turn-helix domain protein [Haliangium ochraceum DSM 14365]